MVLVEEDSAEAAEAEVDSTDLRCGPAHLVRWSIPMHGTESGIRI